MATRLYVGNLPFSATEEELRELFGAHGTVEVVELMMDRATGRPRGFGFVQMDAEGAKQAIEKLDGQQMGGRTLNVNEARERTAERPARPRRENRW
ncbi:MAG: RNA-binding protein [Calditrichaeota bacterium]|nr:RNA-binding protein [Calditrichota bacterium]MCB9391761.1 RNA-binding protein [Calditrichota bacterium]